MAFNVVDSNGCKVLVSWCRFATAEEADDWLRRKRCPMAVPCEGWSVVDDETGEVIECQSKKK